MRGSLGLAAYKALSLRGPTPQLDLPIPRPDGELIWLHAAEPGSGRAVGDLARSIITARPGLSILVTTAEDVSADRVNPTDTLLVTAAPPDHPTTVNRFLDHWRPNLLIWIWGGLRPNLILSTESRDIPMFLINAGEAGFDARRDRWLPEVSRQLLETFDAVLARSDDAQEKILRLGCRPEITSVTGPLQPTGQALPALDSDLTEMTDTLAGRPVWLAAGVTVHEWTTVLSAHRSAIRLSPRLLLIGVPLDPDDGPTFAQMCKKEGLRQASWADGAIPDDSHQVLVADTMGELGLWYRLAPVAFLGNSLLDNASGCDPYPAAAVGVAILYGPNVRGYLQSYSRLAAAGAARIINDADSLSTAVSHLIAPDQAAQMAMAGWDVVSRGADVSDRVLNLVHDALDGTADRTN
ncbi:MAG: glycosyltransferase N-terminal domain-containing protein [Pseudomonadota bacterium]